MKYLMIIASVFMLSACHTDGSNTGEGIFKNKGSCCGSCKGAHKHGGDHGHSH